MNLESIQIAHDQKWRILERFAIVEQLLVCGCEVFALSLVLPGEVLPLPDIGESIAPIYLARALFECVPLAVRVGLEGFAEKSIENLSAAIEASKKPRLDRFLYALGIEHVGGTVAGLLAGHFGALSGIMDASEEDLQEIRGIGPEVAESVHHFFSNKRNRKVIERLLKAGVRPIADARPSGPQPLDGETVVFTGGLETMPRPDAQRLAERAGAKVTSGVSKKVTLVVAGPGAGSKLEDAQRLGIKVISEAEFLKRVGAKK